MDGYRELRETAAWFDLSGRGKILLRGEDRARLLHAMTTNHVQQLVPGTGIYAFCLNAQGRILADVNVLCLEDSLLLDTEPETRETLFQHLDKYIIADDVALEDVTADTATIAVEGPGAGAALGNLGAPVPETPWSWAPWEREVRIARLSRTGQPGWWIIAPAGEKEAIRAALDLPEASREAVETVRIEGGVPRYGQDFTEANIPQETQLMHALHFNKGCYIGQEIVERVRSRGHVNRLLVRLSIDSRNLPQAGSKVTSGENEAGWVTSAAWSPASGTTLAFAYLRNDIVRASGPLSVGGLPATLASSGPAVPSESTGCA